MPAFNFAGQSYTSRSLPLDAQRCVNMFVERSPPDAKTQVPLFMFPGLKVFARAGKGPINGLHAMAGLLYMVSGGELFSVNAQGLATSLGVTTLGGTISMADNGTQLVMVDGEVGWVYQVGGLNQVLTDTAYGYLATTLTATAIAGATTIDVVSAAGMASGHSISVFLDSGTVFTTTISGAPSGNVVTLTGALPSQATLGAGVRDTSVGTSSVTLASIGKPAVGQTINITLDSGAVFSTTISGVSGLPAALNVTLASPLPSQATAGALAIIPSVVLGKITAPAFQAANTVVYFDDYFIFSATGTNQFFLSSIGDGTQYNGLDFASAQANPDTVQAVINYHEQLLVFGGYSVEVWYDSGSANFPFSRYDGAYIQRGAASPLAIVQEDNTVFWLGEDGIFYRLNGYSPQRVSTFGTEQEWAQYVTITDATAFVVTVEGHKFIFLTFLAGNKTWCYDIASGVDTPLWYERESLGSPWV